MDESNWVVVAQFPGRIESDLARGVLEQAGIPVLEKGPAAGIFGPGFGGATTEGITLLVPNDQLEAAQELVGEE